MRRGRDAKVRKDRSQAIVLCAALAEFYPGALRDAVQNLPCRAVKHFRRALERIREAVGTDSRTWDELSSM